MVKRRLNPFEVRKVSGVLTDPQYDTDDDPKRMATDIIRLVNEHREREHLWVVGVQPEGRPPTLHGPYLTVKQALAKREEALIGYGDTPVRLAVWALHPDLDEVWAEQPVGMAESGHQPLTETESPDRVTGAGVTV